MEKKSDDKESHESDLKLFEEEILLLFCRTVFFGAERFLDAMMYSKDLENDESSEEESKGSYVEHDLEKIIFWEEVSIMVNRWS